ncbi:MAG: putative lipid II flippase FtsW [Candidatus Kerfeldbacteria bacterium]|nr:putative lipid II flippase FtsW [Candidatus Kerfeldbacteria bacterium]
MWPKISSSKRQTNSPDYVFLLWAGIWVILGLIFLTSASSVLGYQKFNDSYFYLKRQLLYGLLPGLAAFTFFSRWPYQNLKKYATPALILSLVLLLTVFIPGLGFKYGGAQRWVNFLGFSFQPSEFVKLTFLVYLSSWLASRGRENLSDLRQGLLPFLLVLGTVLGLVLLQKDLGTASVIGVSALLTFFVAGANLVHLGLITVFGSGALWWLIMKVGYRAQRFTVFLDPSLDPQGIGYHINQALLAVGSGGLFGLGIGYSRQKYQYLPEVTGDSIFAVIAEELGFVFTTLFIILLMAFFWRGFKIARQAPDEFGRYLAIGILAWLAWQTGINMASMVNILPLTGVPLPLVSSGGTALMTALAAIGILINISRQAKSLPKKI